MKILEDPTGNMWTSVAVFLEATSNFDLIAAWRTTKHMEIDSNVISTLQLPFQENNS